MPKKHLVLAVAAAVAVPLAVSSCSSSSAVANDGSAVAAPGVFQPKHRGGTLVIASQAAAGTIDPQISYDPVPWEAFQAVYDGLTAFKKVGGAGSETIVPNLAAAMPALTDGGTTYTFTLRSGIAFSTGKPLTTDDVVASFRRIYKASGPTAGTFFANIVGADACVKTPNTCVLPGVTADKAKGTVTIRLTQPDPEFLEKLALPHAAILPANTPAADQGTKPIPGTGPYRISAFDPNKQMTMVRNPHFRVWSQDAEPPGYPDKIEFRYGLTVEDEITAVENGQADYVTDRPPADRLNEIGTRYARQVHLSQMPTLWYLPLNVNMAPFNNLQARQAVEWALDRNAIVKLFGGNHVATPACTILPPTYPEHVDTCDYTKGGGTRWHAPDLAKARQLVKESGTAGQPVSIVVSNDDINSNIGQYIQSVLNQIGYHATIKQLSNDIQFTYIQNSKNKVQISLTQWYEDYPAPSDFLNVLLSCASYHPGSDSSINIGGYCDKSFDAGLAQAETDQRVNPAKAKAEWAALDQRAMSQALLVPLFNPKQVDFVSSRFGNYQYTTEFNMLVAQAWVK